MICFDLKVLLRVRKADAGIALGYLYDKRVADPVARAKMRLWTKAVDEDMHPACAEITFASSHRHTVNRLGPEEVRKFLESTPPQSVTPQWHERKKEIVVNGFKAPGVVVSYTDDAEIQSAKKFIAEGLQTASGVPLQCDEPADYRAFRIGLFGLDKLGDIDGTVARLTQALTQATG